MGRISPRAVYLGLLVVRLCFALFGTGYIHPDEWFQNGEATAGRTLDVYTHLTWEWDPVFPCRSIVPVWLTTGVPFLLVRIFQGDVLNPRILFAAERLSFFLSSLLLDYALYHLVHEPVRSRALILLGSSYVMHTYQVRPFSNSIEAVLVALSLLLLKRILVAESLKRPAESGYRYLVILAFVATCGLFTRITFAVFFLPVAFEVLKYTLRRSRFALLPWLWSLVLPMLVVAATALGFVYADSTYFVFPSRESIFELTPLNFLRYNLLPANLAEHGLHPRWLHLVVNLPMIATPGLLIYVFWAEWDYTNSRDGEQPRGKRKDGRGAIETIQRVLYWVRWSGTTLLSIQPHQEPRFLIPLVTPMIALVLNHGRILRAGKWFWSVWIVSNLVLALLFGILHQGGVVPSLFRVHNMIYGGNPPTSEQPYLVLYWKTYMPPRHLLAVPQSHADMKAVRVFDVAGAPVSGVVRALSLSGPGMIPNSTTLLVAPFHAVHSFDAPAQECLILRDQVFPHLDLDHISEAVEVGWRDSLSLGIWEMDLLCFDRTVPADA